ncbi:NitT/TauT family transport system ATP-binding protein [Bifidobacterium commune]|uniref:NitT/TauT family transport system ATP-binding protein n=1 Tax=Bifidobacterium commune TaxID=1505727 RepID=A0A1C4GZ80_9BIFI|nr:AAA-associated domain-containing protein [Bifidobacterium commune]MBB2955478.1 NitT/TauT family transport system ATP-binding protein [Bifidobacterium commune]SCC77936.1 NitT/TauT family transport system ATP-binding protein [Bifidobacterium commune]
MNFNKLRKAITGDTEADTITTIDTREHKHNHRPVNPHFVDLDADNAGTVIEASHISQSFTSEKGNETTVLDDISFDLHEGEIVAILGRSGAGKSTFLRILAGLIPPSTGQVSYRDKELNGPNPGVALVFQTFALMPWLSVKDNVELGLEARGIPRAQREKMALEAIDAIGLDGFESAYPKELSGGMKQRIGIARALVLQPDALFMDEPFSALDVLTAENLRQEVLKLWNDNQSGIKSILIVTHNIEEAVQMADRVVVLGSHPGHLIAQVPVDLPRPRDKHTPEFEAMVDKLYTILTGQESQNNNENAEESSDNAPADQSTSAIQRKEAAASDAATSQTDENPQTPEDAGGANASDKQNSKDERNQDVAGKQTTDGRKTHDATQAKANEKLTAHENDTKAKNTDAGTELLPNATPGGLAGLLDVVSNYQDGVDLSDLAADLSFEVDDLFPLIDAATMLSLLTVNNGHCSITKEGDRWCHAGVLEAKQMFAQLVMDHAPLVRTIDRALHNNPDKDLRGELILDLLRSQHTDEEAQQQFDIAVTWGRYGELFDYDSDDDKLTLDDADK